jgi:hypothetical protein
VDKKVIPITAIHNPEYYDNTQLSDYKTCPRYYYLRHVRGWRVQGTAMPLIFGLAWHAAMDIIWRGYKKVPIEPLVDTAMAAAEEVWVDEGLKPFADLDMQDLEMLGARTPMVLKEMLHGYIEARKHILANAELIAAERPFAVPIYEDNPNVWYIGRRDKDISYNGDKLVIEHKTTSEYKVDGGFKSSYLESWHPNSQCEGYLYASNIELGGVRYVWVDAALVHKKVHDKFRFIPISATFGNLDNWLWEARDWISRVQSEKERLAGQPSDRPVMGAFPRNTNSCSGKYGLCSFLNVCRGWENPAQLDAPPAGYVHDPWHPFEILKIAELGMPDDKPETVK